MSEQSTIKKVNRINKANADVPSPKNALPAVNTDIEEEKVCKKEQGDDPQEQEACVVPLEHTEHVECLPEGCVGEYPYINEAQSSHVSQTAEVMSGMSSSGGSSVTLQFKPLETLILGGFSWLAARHFIFNDDVNYSAMVKQPNVSVPLAPPPISPQEPKIEFNDITNDNVLNLVESQQAEITLSGTVTNARENDVVTLQIGTETITAVVKNGVFTVTTSGEILAKNHEIVATLTTRDEAGNEATASHTHAYRVITEIAQPGITLNPVTDGNIINLAESQQTETTLSGTVTNARENDVVTLQIGEETITAEVKNGVFTVTTSGEILAKNHEIVATLTTRDEAGNEATASHTHAYRVIKEIAQPEITLNPVTDGNIINLAESQQAETTLSGTVTNARENDVVTLQIGEETITAEVKNGVFTVTTSGEVLAKNQEIVATLTTRDEAGNEATASHTHAYRVITEIAQPEITLNPVTDGNIINLAESQQAEITLSGTVTNARENDVVTLQIGTESIQTTLKNGVFTATTSGEILAKNHEIVATLTTRDETGNEATASHTHAYRVITEIAQPEITLNPVTDGNIINLAESQQAEITLSGTVTNARENDVVTLKIGAETITAEVKNGIFTATTSGEILSKNQEIVATLTTRDEAGNEATANHTHAYRVITEIAQPEITLNPVTDGNIINLAESQQAEITLSGTVTNARENDVVTLKIGAETITAEVKNGIFTATTSGEILSKNHEIVATLTTRDEAGNQATASHTHAYRVITEIAQPEITLNPVTDGNIINLAESQQAEITLSGTVTNARENDVMTLQIGTETITAEVKNGIFTATTSGEILSKNHEIVAALTTRDEAGNEATASHTHAYRVITEIAQPDITLNPVTDGNIINFAESQQAEITLSGTVTNARENDVVTLKIGTESIQTTVKNGVFTATTSGEILAKNHEIVATLTTRDEAGNEATASHTHAYRVITEIAQPEITLNPVTDGNIINLAESQQAEITLSGTVTNARENDVVTLKIGAETITAEVKNGIFTATTSGEILAKNHEIVATLTTRDEAGNEATASHTHAYRVITEIAQPSITLNDITSDNVLNVSEGKLTEITLSGKVTNARENDVVSLNVGNTTLSATVKRNGEFSTTIRGDVLARAKEVVATLTTLDELGKMLTVKTSKEYKKLVDVQITQVGEDVLPTLAEFNQIVRLKGYIDPVGDYAVGRNIERIGAVTINIGDQKYSAGINYSDRSFFIDMPKSEILSLVGKEVSYSFEIDDYVYKLNKISDHQYEITSQYDFYYDTAQIATVRFDENIVKNGTIVLQTETISLVKGKVSEAGVGSDVYIVVENQRFKAEVDNQGNFIAELPRELLNSQEHISVQLWGYDTGTSTNSALLLKEEKVELVTFGNQSDNFVHPHSRLPVENVPYFINALDVYTTEPYLADLGFLQKYPVGTKGSKITYHFATAVETEAQSQIETPEALDVPTIIQDSVREMFTLIQQYVDIEFVEVSDSSAEINFHLAKLIGSRDDAAAYARFGGFMVLNSTYFPKTNDEYFSDYDKTTLFHELLHTLGFKHPFEKGDTLPDMEEHTGLTILSYTEADSDFQNNSNFGMAPYDIAALHYRYGVNPNTRAENNIYTFKTFNDKIPDGDIYIWDGAGVDLFDASKETSPVTFSLMPGSWIYAGEKSPTLAIKHREPATGFNYFGLKEGIDEVIKDSTRIYSDGAFTDEDESYRLHNIEFTEKQAFIGFGTQIENLIGSSHNDSLTGNLADNHIFGGEGDDEIAGKDGDDILDGGKGKDTLRGGEGNDRYIVDNEQDKVIENTGEGNDTVYSSVSYTLPTHVENLLLLGSAERGTGNSANNRLQGSYLDNILYGEGGDDILIGGAGNDVLYGGNGRDIFVFTDFSYLDEIKDFNVQEDKLQFDRTVFNRLKDESGHSDFTALKYDTATGALGYQYSENPDEFVHFANLTPELDLDHTHFVLG